MHKRHNWLQEAYREHVSHKLSYHIIVRWVCVFWDGQESSEHKLVASQPLTAADEVHVSCGRTLLDANQ